jgi:hypothetical protein
MILLRDFFLLEVVLIDTTIPVAVPAEMNNSCDLDAVHFQTVTGWKWVVEIRTKFIW